MEEREIGRGAVGGRKRGTDRLRDGVGPWKHLEEGNRQSGPVISRRDNWQIDRWAQPDTSQRLGTDTPALRDKGTEGVVEAGRHLEGQMTIGQQRPIQAERQTGWMDRPGNSRGTGTGLGRARPL